MIFEKGKFSFIINRIGSVDIRYRKFIFEIGFFNEDEIPLFSLKLFNLVGDIKTFQIFSLVILKFNISININY